MRRELGLSCAVLEQSTIAATLRAFPRGKIVHDPPIELPLEGALWLRESTKEELVAQWTRIVRAHRLDVRERHRVTGVAGEAGDFAVSAETPGGARTVRAARVLFAIGRRGHARAAWRPTSRPRPPRASSTPSRTRAPSPASASSSSAWATRRWRRSSRSHASPGRRSPCPTAAPPSRRGRAHNIDEVRRLAASGRVRIVFESTVERVDERWALLRTPGRGEGLEKVPVDAVLALLGGEPSRALLEGAGVRIEGG